MCSKGQQYNCLTWAIAKLVEAGIVKHNVPPVFVPYPPFYLNGRHTSERQLLSGVTEEQVENLSPSTDADAYSSDVDRHFLDVDQVLFLC